MDSPLERKLRECAHDFIERHYIPACIASAEGSGDYDTASVYREYLKNLQRSDSAAMRTAEITFKSVVDKLRIYDLPPVKTG